jgi:hypothetical protein
VESKVSKPKSPWEEVKKSQWDEAKKAAPGCHSIAPAGSITDEWCLNNCAMGNCPSTMCSGECHLASAKSPANSTESEIEHVRRLLEAKEAEAEEVRGVLMAREASAKHEAESSKASLKVQPQQNATSEEARTEEAAQNRTVQTRTEQVSPSPAPAAAKNETKKLGKKNATVDAAKAPHPNKTTEAPRPSPSPLQPSPIPLRPSPIPLRPSPAPAGVATSLREERMAAAKRRWNKAAGIAEDGEPKKEVGCHMIAEGGNASDEWCKDNCAIGYCPAAMCSPECKLYGATTLFDAEDAVVQPKKSRRLVSPLAAQPGRKADPKATEG